MSMIMRAHNGYIFLVTILVVGVIAAATATSLLLLAWAAEQNGLIVVQSQRAYEYTQTCGERALRLLRKDASYGGSSSYSFTYGSCSIGVISGAGNEDRDVCVTGTSGDSTRRMQIEIKRIYPSVLIENWKEVEAFTLCS
jgi:hypothetical protein